MTFLPEPKLKVLRALRREPLDQYQIAADTGMGHFIVLDELKALRRDQFVREQLRGAGRLWELTRNGWRELQARDQLELDL